MKNFQNHIAIGSSRDPDSRKAVREVTRSIQNQLGAERTVVWALAFCGGRHNAQTVIQDLCKALGTAQIAGGAAVGVISKDVLGSSGYELSVAAFSDLFPEPTLFLEKGLKKNEIEAGERLGNRLREVTRDEDTVLLFYDSIKSGPPPVLHVGSYLVEGIYRGLQGRNLKLVGGGTASDLHMSDSYIFAGGKVLKHAVAAVVLPSQLDCHTKIMHGCVPVSSFMEITKIDGAVLYELNNHPALEVLMEMLDSKRVPSVADHMSLSLTIGEKQGDPFGPYDESAYVNRLILTGNPEDGSVVLFEADFKAGSKVQIMSRDHKLMLQSVEKGTHLVLETMKDFHPFFALYIDCAGRCNAFSGGEVEEASIVRDMIGSSIPLLGFYSGVEIAPLLGRSRPLDWTGVLTLFTVNEAHL